MFFCPVDDRTHTLRGTGVLVQEFFYPGEIDCLLDLPVLEIVVADVAQLAVIGADNVRNVRYGGSRTVWGSGF